MIKVRCLCRKYLTFLFEVAGMLFATTSVRQTHFSPVCRTELFDLELKILQDPDVPNAGACPADTFNKGLGEAGTLAVAISAD